MGFKFNPFTGTLDIAGGGSSVAGSDKQIQFNDGGVAGADANLVFDKTTDSLGVQVAAPLAPLHVAGVTGSTINNVATASVAGANEVLNASPTGTVTVVPEFSAPSGSGASSNTSGSGYSATNQTIDYNIYAVIYDSTTGAYYRSQFFEAISYSDALGDSSSFSVIINFATSQAEQTHWWIEKQVNGGGFSDSVIWAVADGSYEDSAFSGTASYNAYPTFYTVNYTAPVNPTGGASGSWNTSYFGLNADGSTYQIDIKSYANIGGTAYTDDINSFDTGSFSDPNDSSMGGADFTWNTATCDGYIVRITKDGGSFWSYHDVGGSTGYVYDGEGNTPTDGAAESTWNRGISTFTGVQYAFKCYGKTTSPSAGTVFSPTANTYYATISTPGENNIFIHSYSGLAGAGGRVLAEYNTGVTNGKNVTGTFVDPGYATWADGISVSPNTFAFSNGSTRYFKFVSYNGTIYSGTPLVTSATTSGAQYFSGSFAYPSGVTQVKILRSVDGVTYTNAKVVTSPTTTFTYDINDTSWSSTTTITPSASVPTAARIDRVQSLVTDVPHLSLIDVAGSGTRYSSIGFGVATSSAHTPTYQSNIVGEASTGYLKIGASRLIGYTSVSQATEQFYFGSANALNLQKSTSVHFTIYAGNATDPLAYFYSASNSSRGTLYLGTTGLTGTVGNSLLVIAPQAGGGDGLVFRRTSGFTGDNIRIDEAGSFKAGWGQSGRMYLNATGVSTSTYLRIGGTSSGSQIRLEAQSVTGSIEGDIWNDSTNKTFACYVNGVKQFINGNLFAQTASATCANTTTETTISSTGQGTLTLPANFLVAGKTLKFKAQGFYSTTLTPTLTFKFKFGSTVVVTTGAVTTVAGSNSLWEFDGTITCRTTGGSGTVFTQGKALLIGATPLFLPAVKTATDTVNTTSSHNITVTAQWGTASASNTITCTNFNLEVII